MSKHCETRGRMTSHSKNVNDVPIVPFEDVGINTIHDLTKQELIECIRYILHYCSRYALDRCISDIAYSRRLKKLDDESAKGDRWIQLQEEYCKLLAPYQGMKIGELPPEIIEKGAKLEREIKKAKEEYLATFESR